MHKGTFVRNILSVNELCHIAALKHFNRNLTEDTTILMLAPFV